MQPGGPSTTVESESMFLVLGLVVAAGAIYCGFMCTRVLNDYRRDLKEYGAVGFEGDDPEQEDQVEDI